MCMCGKPVVNGEPGYSWDGKMRLIRPPNPPDLLDGDTLLFDEPGRCGGLDAHAYHFRVVRDKPGVFALLVRHGGGSERFSLGSTTMAIDALKTLTSTGRFWLLMRLYHVQSDAVHDAVAACNLAWRKAAAEGRIKARKVRNSERVKVWIEEPEAAQ